VHILAASAAAEQLAAPQTILLGVAVTIGQTVHRYCVTWLSEAGTSLLVGVGVGLILNILPLPIEFEGVFSFSVRPGVVTQGFVLQRACLRSARSQASHTLSLAQTEFFFIALLPPIIFDAAFNLKTRT